MAYTKTNWQDLPSTSTPINATNLNKIENELESVDKSLKYIGNAPTDWNDAKTFGIYHVSGTYTNAPTSSSIWGVLIVYENKGGTWTPSTSGSGSWIWQEFRTTKGKIFRRKAENSLTSWSEWNDSFAGYVGTTTTLDIDFSTKKEGIYLVYSLNSTNDHYRKTATMVVNSNTGLIILCDASGASTVVNNTTLRFNVTDYFSNVRIQILNTF